MYNSFQLTKKYLHYYLTAFNSKGHGMHSPFVFDFILHVLNNKSHYTPPSSIEQIRKALKLDKRLLKIEDMGAGSRIHKGFKQKQVKELASTALKSKKYGQLLFRLVKHYQPGKTIELGTSLGITTAYLGAGNPDGSVITIEGSKEIRDVALENFEKLGIQNISSLQGNFDQVLPAILSQENKLDLCYIDGNHRYEPTIDYFNQLLRKSHNDTILVFDDIHWSREMEKAWSEIKLNPSVRCTIDIFFLGFVFLRKEFKEKQDFIVRF